MAKGAAEPHDHHDHDGHDHHGHDHDHHDHDHDHEIHHHHAPEDTDLRLVAFDAFGVPVAVSVPSGVVARLGGVIPPGVTVRQGQTGDAHFILSPGTAGDYVLLYGTERVAASADLKVALEVLATRVREHIADNAPRHTFIHAGAVAHGGRGILIPGLSFSGKTTLVAELVRAGATYYSDEYAVIDEDGMLHPYAKPLAIRRAASYEQTDHDVSSFGGTAGVEPIPVGLIVLSWFERGAEWNPQRLSTGEAVVAVLANTVPNSERPNEPLASVTRAVSGATALQGPRGEASTLAAELLGAAVA